MKLSYRVLWFDDQEQAIKPSVERVHGMIARLGFEPSVELRIITADVAEPLKDLPSQAEVDLVLMDWKLGGQHDGAELARKLRLTFKDTDFIFYSSEPANTLRKLIFDKDIDGVFCVTRQHLSDRANSIIQGQLRRILDLNHMRGIVMAATSDLDQGMVACLEVLQDILHPGESMGAFAESVSTKVAGALRKKADEIDALGKKAKLPKLLREPSFGSALRLQVLQEEVAKLADRVAEPHLIEQLGKYHEEVITPRNDFAHRKAELKDGKLHLEGRDQPLDHDAMKALRLRLLAHSDNLLGLLTLLRELAGAAGEPKLAEKIAAVEAVVVEAADAAAEASPPDVDPAD